MVSNKYKAGMGFAIATVLLDAIGIGIIFPIMPDLLLDLGIDSVSNAALYGGALATAYAVMQFIFLPVMGNLSDRYGRRPVLLVAIAALAVDYIVMGLAQSFALLFIGRVIAGIAGATVATATAYIADISPARDRAKNFGLIGAAFGVGFILGPAIGGLAGNIDVRLPFFIAAGFALLNFLFGLFFLPESLKVENRRPFSLARANPFGALIRAFAMPRLRRPLFMVFLFMLAGYSYASVWSFYGKEKFAWDAGTIGLTLAAFGVGVIFVQGVLIRYTMPALGEGGTIRLGLVAFGLAMLGISLAGYSWVMFALIPVAVLGEIAGPAISGMLSNMVSDKEQGDLQGIMGSIEAVAAIIAPPVFTGLFKLFTADGWPYFPGAPFLLAALIAALALLVFMMLKPKEN